MSQFTFYHIGPNGGGEFSFVQIFNGGLVPHQRLRIIAASTHIVTPADIFLFKEFTPEAGSPEVSNEVCIDVPGRTFDYTQIRSGTNPSVGLNPFYKVDAEHGNVLPDIFPFDVTIEIEPGGGLKLEAGATNALLEFNFTLEEYWDPYPRT